MIKRILIISVFVLLTAPVFSQYLYRTAVGFRMGSSMGVSVKHFLTPETALDFNFAFYRSGLWAFVNYEFERFDFNNEQWAWYYGMGGHIGYYSEYEDLDLVYSPVVLGANAIVGIEYAFKEVPINLALDINGIFHMWGTQGARIDNIALVVRYYIAREKY